ncbi:Protein of unknown function [Cotesia congregata]|uniref:Uncharacterized protein n=1 Tax=Cotesia congregata TaxID=51543 RepID=A0A8J2MK98_COTCN|nr:Protein of unknown function [Cotesia congregata]
MKSICSLYNERKYRYKRKHEHLNSLNLSNKKTRACEYARELTEMITLVRAIQLPGVHCMHGHEPGRREKLSRYRATLIVPTQLITSLILHYTRNKRALKTMPYMYGKYRQPRVYGRLYLLIVNWSYCYYVLDLAGIIVMARGYSVRIIKIKYGYHYQKRCCYKPTKLNTLGNPQIKETAQIIRTNISWQIEKLDSKYLSYKSSKLKICYHRINY